jgi:tRNA(Ile)-lysidine synthase
MRDDAAALDAWAARLLEEARAACPAGTEGADEAGARPLGVAVLAAAEAAPRRRAIRLWLALGRGDLRRVELSHVLAVEKLLEGSRGGRVAELPGGARVERRRGLLIFSPPGGARH